MKKKFFLAAVLFCSSAFIMKAQLSQQPATIKLAAASLMHEMRATPSPLDNATVGDRKVSFQWPLQSDYNIVEIFDAHEVDEATKKKKENKENLRYMLRYSQDTAFKDETTVTVRTRWPFYNPEKDLKPGVWYWQFGYVVNGETKWASTQRLTVEANPDKFCPPSYKDIISRLPAEHPRVYMDKKSWEDLIKRSEGSADRKTYIDRAEKALKVPMKSVNDINVKLAANLKNEAQRKAMMTRESRRIIDREEANMDILVRAYLLTKDKRYANEAIKRVKDIVTWKNNKNVVGDFNFSTLLSICATTYDGLYDLLDKDTKRLLLENVKYFGSKMYQGFNNHLENHIADNHAVQMTLRLFTMAAFSVYGDLPEADIWTEYCYNIWVARFPGLNKDGAWHNGDSYCNVNIRTLIEVPYFYSRVSGFDFFTDPWYQGNALYTIYQHPPFSHSGGNGSGHLEKTKPYGVRVGYADALAKLTGNTYAADYVRTIQAKKPKILTEGSLGKAGGLAWFRLLCDKPLPEGRGLKDLPMGHVFSQSGLASFATHLDRTPRSAMISFRSSPFGSTSHSLANQNAFNTFWAGEAIFYSTGHHTSYIDRHALFCERSSRAHNTILVNGMGQRIGIEGYGWIPRYYVGDKIGYVVGDASNAYGKVVSETWKKRAAELNIELSPENGWDDVPLNTFRRHIVELGRTGLTFIYDELEASEPVTWSYLLHTITNPMEVDESNGKYTYIKGTAKKGVSEAFLFSTGKLGLDVTDKFFAPADNWLKADANGNFERYPNHWHFTATSDKQNTYRFATIINTHEKVQEGEKPALKPTVRKDGTIKMGAWIIKVNLSADGKPFFHVYNNKEGEDVSVKYEGEETIVREDGYETKLKDNVPELEI